MTNKTSLHSTFHKGIVEFSELWSWLSLQNQNHVQKWCSIYEKKSHDTANLTVDILCLSYKSCFWRKNRVHFFSIEVSAFKIKLPGPRYHAATPGKGLIKRFNKGWNFNKFFNWNHVLIIISFHLVVSDLSYNLSRG